MTLEPDTLGRFEPLCGLGLGFFDDREARSLANLSAFGPPGRFSARLGSASRGPQGGKKFRHAPPHLLRGDGARGALPGLTTGLDQGASQQQVIVGNRHNLGPAFKLLWGSQARCVPQQVLFLKAITVFDTKAAAIGRSDLLGRQELCTGPDKPTDTWTASALGSGQARQAVDGELDLPCLLDMQMIPALHEQALPLLINALPLGIRYAMGLLILASKTGSIFARCASLARGRRCRPVEDPIAFAAQQAVERQRTDGPQKGGRRIV